MFKRLLITLAVVSLMLPAIAMAEQIGVFFDNGNDYFLTQISVAGSLEEQLSINHTGTFTFGNVGTPIDNVNRSAVLNLTATSSTGASTNIGGNVEEDNFSGSFTITDVLTSQILLAGVFGPGGSLVGGASVTTFQDQTPPVGEVTYSSDYISISSAVNQGFAFSLSNFTPGLSIDTTTTPHLLVNATAAGSGTFSADESESKTPEPASMLLSGGALLGLGALLRKRKAQAVR